MAGAAVDNVVIGKISRSSLATQYYPCTGQAICSEPLVLLHGWASDSQVWQPLIDLLNNSFSLITLDLPGFGESPALEHYTTDKLLELMAAVLPERILLTGWSLGGMLAVEFATRHPRQVCGLITIGSNASFIRRDDWPEAMDAATFESFCRLFNDNPELCLKRFVGLEAKGETDERQALQQLRQLSQAVPKDVERENWRRGLALLGELDQRRRIADLALPALFIFGDGDNLVPASVAGQAIYRGADKRTLVLENRGHASIVTAVDRIAHEIEQFVAGHQRRLDKQQIAQSFSRAAASYDRVARLQRETGHELFEQIPDDIDPKRILDLGCGTGYFSCRLRERFPVAEIIGLDLAEGMVRFASENGDQNVNCQWLCGDAEALPLADNSFDLVFSNLVLQWCENLPVLSAELLRIMAPRGLLLYTTLGPETLHELRHAWSSVDEVVHVNNFPTADLLSRFLEENGCRSNEFKRHLKVLHYAQLRDLTAELKGLGAHNVNQGRRTSITGRARIAGLLRAYEGFRRDDGQLPASWDVVYGRVEK